MDIYNRDECCLGFSLSPAIGPIRYLNLLNAFGDVETSFHANEGDISRVIGPDSAKKFTSFRDSYKPKVYVEHCKRSHIMIITQFSTLYPPLLLQIPDPPICLFALHKDHNPNLTSELPIAIVGSRKSTTYGKTVTEQITSDLVASGATIVSGLALGIDAIAHQAALDSHGKTIAVLGCGVDIVYPVSNTSLRQSVLSSGNVLISEFAPGVQPTRGSFVIRNRIISGISRGVVVIEGTDHSGSLNIASSAAHQGRDVFAVPGPITSVNSQAPLILMKQGAKIVSSASDILNEYTAFQSRRNEDPVRELNKDESDVYTLLRRAPQHPDDIVRVLGWNIITVTNILSILEVEGMISVNQEGRYHPTSNRL